MTSKSRSAFDLVLACDAETSGIAFGSIDPTFHSVTAETYQALSFGLIVADVHTLQPIDTFYVEIKHDEQYDWSPGAEKVHGMSQEYLEANGVTMAEAAQKIVAFLEPYFGPIESVRKLVLLGHNVATFDRYFLDELLKAGGYTVQFGNRHIDTFSMGVTLLNCFDSNELFDTLGLARDPNAHNALEDAKHALKAARLMKKFFNQK